jgi:hypothetical protein
VATHPVTSVWTLCSSVSTLARNLDNYAIPRWGSSLTSMMTPTEIRGMV